MTEDAGMSERNGELWLAMCYRGLFVSVYMQRLLGVVRPCYKVPSRHPAFVHLLLLVLHLPHILLPFHPVRIVSLLVASPGHSPLDALAMSSSSLCTLQSRRTLYTRGYVSLSPG
jgi:hypothetical protein